MDNIKLFFVLKEYLLRSVAIAFICLLLLYSCSEESIQKEEELPDDLKINNSMNMKDFKSTSIYNIFVENYKKPELSTRSASSAEEFYTSTGEPIIPTYLDNGTTYSIPIKSSNNENNTQLIQRLFIEKTLNGNILAYIIKISVEKGEAQIIPIKLNTESTETIIGDEPHSGLINCTSIVVSYSFPCNCKPHHYPGDNCGCTDGKPYEITKVLNICYEEGPIHPDIDLSNNGGAGTPISPAVDSRGGSSGHNIYIGPSREVAKYLDCLKNNSKTGSDCINLPKLDHYKGGPEIEPKKTPCKKAAEQLQNPALWDKIQELKGKTGLKKETGYAVNKDGTFTQLNPDPITGNCQIEVKPRNTVGYIHTHLNDFETGEVIDGMYKVIKPIRMFSHTDVIQFLRIVKNSQYNGISTSDVFGMMISSSGTYMLKFEGNPSDIDGFRRTKDELKSIYKKYFKENYNKEKAFLLFLKNEINVEGIRLIKIKSKGQTQTKTLNTKSRVDTNNCQ